jgi:serine/threonine protein kinase
MPLHDSFSRNPLQKRTNDAILENLNLATPPSRKDIAFTLGRALESAPSAQVLQWKAHSGAVYQMHVSYKGEMPTWNLMRVDVRPATLIWKIVTEDPEQVYRMLLKRITPQGDFTKTTGANPVYDEAEQRLLLAAQSLGVGSVFLDRYRIDELIAKGGMGIVFKAFDLAMNRLVAVKVLHTHLVEDTKAKQRFDNEMNICISFKHPNVVSVFDYGYSAEDVPYMVMEYLDGRTLDDYQLKMGPLSVETFIMVFSQVCAALIHAHEKQYIHRDVKPRNIVMIPQPVEGEFIVKLVDFGIAKVMQTAEKTLQKLTQTGDALGSPFYMSPEQCRSQVLDARSDIYSLGCVMYESLSGKLPFHGPNAISTLFMHVNDRAEPFSAWRPDLNIPRFLEKTVLKMLEKDPLNRFQSVAEIANEIAEFARVYPYLPSSLDSRKNTPNSKKGNSVDESKSPAASVLVDTSMSPSVSQISQTSKTSQTSQTSKFSEFPDLSESPETPELPELPIIDAVLKILIQSSIITAEDARSAMTLHQWNGGQPVQYLVEFGCISEGTLQSAMQCLDMMHRYSLPLEDAALTLMYCHRKGISIDDALAEVE